MNRYLAAILATSILIASSPDTSGAARPHAVRRGAGNAAPAPLPTARGSLLKGLLPNGLRVLIWYDPDLETETVCLSVGVGSQLDMERKQGAAALVSEILLTGHSGGKPAGELASAWEDHGDPVEVRCDEDAASYLLNVEPEAFKDALQSFGQLMLGSEMRDEDFQAALATARMRLADSAPWSRIEPALRVQLYGPYGYHRCPAGTPEGYSNVTREICQGYYSQYYRPNNSVLVLTGPVEPEVARKAALAGFGDWKYGYVPPSSPNEPTPLTHVATAAVPAPDSIFAIRGAAIVPRMSLPDRVALEVWCDVLGSRDPEPAADTSPGDSLIGPSPVFRRSELRRHRLCDEVRFGWVAADTDVGGSIRSWVADMTSPDSARVWSALDRGRAASQDRLTDELGWTLEAARTTLFGRVPETPDELRRAVAAVTPRQVREAVRRLLGPERWAIVVTAPRSQWESAVNGATQ